MTQTRIRSIHPDSKQAVLAALLCAVFASTIGGILGCAATQDSATRAASASVETTETTAADAAESVKDSAAAEAAAKISFGNGEANWIVTDGLRRDGSTMTFREVQIDGNGWLVLHPFKDGRPNGAIHVGASYLRDGMNQDVAITVEQPAEPNPGEMFLVMLHSDVNENQEFDFVFVDERNVLDRAVFEGLTMIAHPIAAP